MKKVVFLLSLLSVILFISCTDEDSDPKYYLQVPVYSVDTQFLGSRVNALKQWTQFGEELYHIRFRDYNELFLFDCIANYDNPKLVGGFEFSNLTSGEYSAITTEGVRGYSYITYRHNPNLDLEDPIRINFREYGDGSKSKAYSVTGLYFTNTVTAYNAMFMGDKYIGKFGKDDWFKLTIYNSNKNQKVEVMLGNGTNLVSKWEYVKLSSLGVTDGLIFELSSSAGDVTEIPSLSYFCLDGIIIEGK